MTTEQIIYTGRVQGVGFRYTVRSIAKLHPITGYVKNLADGTVELMAQGDPKAINALLVDVATQFRQNIDHCERRVVPESEIFEVFEIRF